MRRTTTTIGWTFEELGKNEGKAIDVEVTISIEPGEERTWDYPGSPPTFEWTDVEVMGWDNDSHTDIQAGNGWQSALQSIAEALVDEHFDEIIEHL